MQKYVEIKRDGLTLRGMLHIPKDVSQKVPMVILLHGFCDDRNEINFVHNELSLRLCDAGIASVRFDMNGRGSRTRTHINGFGDRYLSLWTIPLSAC